MERQALVKRIMEIATGDIYAERKVEMINTCIRGQVADALNLLDNIKSTSVSRADLEEREKELMKRFGLTKAGNGQYL